MAAFRLNARNIFLTYAQCSLDGNDLLLKLEQHEPTAVFIRVAAEQHEDGSPHLHALLRFPGKRDIRHADHFDFDGFHPKIEPCRNWKKSLNYLSKGGVFYDFAEEGYDAEPDGIPDPADFETKGSYLRACLQENIPYGYADQFWKLENKVDKHITEPGGGTVEHLDLLDREPARAGSTLVVGPSGVGKTQWATQWAPKPCLLASHIDDLKQVTANTQSIIFDDMDFRHWPRTSQIHLVDTDYARSINVRYGTISIPAGIKKFFTANPESYPFLRDDAINRRLEIINLS